MKVTILCLRIIQLVLALGTLGSAITVVHWFNMNSGKASPGAFNILVAVPLIALLSLVYLEVVPRVAPSASHPIPSLFCEAFTFVLFLAGCGVSAQFVARLDMCVGAICSAAYAAPILAGISVPWWVLSTILLVNQMFTHGFRRPSATRPAMSQA